MNLDIIHTIKNYTHKITGQHKEDRECWRLQEFDDKDFDKVEKLDIADTHLYSLVGNSINVKVLEAIYKELLRDYVSQK